MRSTSPTAACPRPTSRTCAPTAPARASTSSTARAPRSATSSSTSRRSRSTTRPSARRSPRCIDRDALSEIYKGTTKPLYSTVPAAFPGAKESFKDAFGDPDPAKAKAILDEAGVATPVELDGWYTPTHYGPVEADLWNEIKRQLDESGLFKVNLDSTEWDQYKDEAFTKGTYYFYGLGWFPDFPDADNYLSPFMRDGGFFVNGYSNKEVNAALDEEIATDDAAAREEAFGKVQDIEAADVPLIPLWEGKQVAARAGRRRGRRQDVRPGVPVPLLGRDQEGGLATHEPDRIAPGLHPHTDRADGAHGVGAPDSRVPDVASSPGRSGVGDPRRPALGSRVGRAAGVARLGSPAAGPVLRVPVGRRPLPVRHHDHRQSDDRLDPGRERRRDAHADASPR